MRPVEAIETAFSKYFTIRGRASRSEYWWFFLFNLVILAIAGALDQSSGSGYSSAVITLITLIPSFTVGIRRLHDKDRSGWWLLLGIIPLIGTLVLLFWFATRGTEGANRFGPDPVV